MTTISSSSDTVSTSAPRTRLTTSPTVAASLRAGTTRLTDRPRLASSSRSSDHSSQWWVLRSNHSPTMSPRLDGEDQRASARPDLLEAGGPLADPALTELPRRPRAGERPDARVVDLPDHAVRVG